MVKEREPALQIVTLRVDMDIGAFRERTERAFLSGDELSELVLRREDGDDGFITLSLCELRLEWANDHAAVYDCKIEGEHPRHGKLRIGEQEAWLDLPVYY